ncbi:MAG: radical SAM protein [Candidatus Thermoplasmatota archaeon]|nr:radical SAM protein [Candidatus Thermoplasmatota archaeon]
MFAPPLGICYLARALENRGDNVEIFDLRYRGTKKEALENILTEVDVVGVSIPSFSLRNAFRLCSFIKEIDPYIPIIIGGPHCSLYPKDVIRKINVDVSVNGEGEGIISMILDALEKGSKPMIPGVFYKDKNGNIKGTKGANIIKNLDEIPFPSRHLVEKYEYGYLFGFKFFKGKCTSTITSRGCPCTCRFCSREITGMEKYRTRSAENVVEELEDIYMDGYNSVIIADDNFLANRKRANRIFDSIIEKGFKLEIFVQGARVDSANKETYEKMKKAGVTTIAFGIESGNQDILDFYNKKTTLDQIGYAVDLSKKTGFFTIGNFIIGAPIENEQHIRNTIQFASSLQLDFALFSILEYSAGSQIWKEAVENGKIRRDEYRVMSDATRGLGKLPLKELERWQKRAYSTFCLTPRYLNNQIRNMVKKKDFSLIRGGINLFKHLF